MESFAATADGWLLATNGIDPVLRWDGLTTQMELAGVEAPTAAPSFSFVGAGGITGTYYAYVRFLDRNGTPGNLSPLAGPVVAASAWAVQYASVPVPSDMKVARRQILRNTAGQTNVFYVDVDTEDLTSTDFQSSLADTLLSAQEAVVLLDDQDNPVANTNDTPPSDKAVVSCHMDRMFLGGEEIYSEGSVKTTLGSRTAAGIGTAWPATFAGRFLWVDGAERSYEIESVDVLSQTLTLLDAYESADAAYASYAIRPPVAQRRLVQFSEPSRPDHWPPTNAIAVQEDGDDITGLMPMDSFLYVLERRHIYRSTFKDDPTEDGYVFLANAGRGCVNDRCWAVVDDAAFLLDEAGVYRFDGSAAESVSAAIQDLFEPPRKVARHRIRFSRRRTFHCVYDQGAAILRWFVCLSGATYPRHALCLGAQTKAWWIEEYPFPIGASCVGPSSGGRRVYLGGPGGRVYQLGTGTLDQVDPDRGTVRGTVSAASPLSLTDAAARFGDDTVGAPVVLVSGRGAGQWRRVVAASGGRLALDRPWSIAPSRGDTYQVGGIRWRYRTGWFRWVPAEREEARRLEILFEPCGSPQTLDALLYLDRSKDPVVFDADYRPEELNGLGSARDRDSLEGDLTRSNGYLQRRMDGHKELYIDGGRYLSWELRGVTNRDPAYVYQIAVDGAAGGGEG